MPVKWAGSFKNALYATGFSYRILNYKECPLLSCFYVTGMFCLYFFSRRKVYGCVVFALLILFAQLKFKKFCNPSEAMMLFGLWHCLFWPFNMILKNSQEYLKTNKQIPKTTMTKQKKPAKTSNTTCCALNAYTTTTTPIQTPEFCSQAGFLFQSEKITFFSSWSFDVGHFKNS